MNNPSPKPPSIPTTEPAVSATSQAVALPVDSQSEEDTMQDLAITENNLKGFSRVRMYNALEGAMTLDAVETRLRNTFPDNFIYRGGRHVALHLADGGPRVLLVVDLES